MHNDERYRELTRPKPNGQSLWGYLIFGPRTVTIPGLIPVGLSTVAEDLRWPLTGTRRAWEEITGQGMAYADWFAPLIWLPNAPKHNPPQSLNVVKAWRRSYEDDLPPCHLKDEAGLKAYAFLQGIDQAFADAFGDVLAKEIADALPTQKQKQKQNQVQPDAVGALWESPRGAQR